jgi:hypothetical protein
MKFTAHAFWRGPHPMSGIVFWSIRDEFGNLTTPMEAFGDIDGKWVEIEIREVEKKE